MVRAGARPERARKLELAPDHLGALARDAGVELAAPACERLVAYGELLLRWNRVHNLTALSAPAELLTHHLLDSLAIVAPLESALHKRDIDPKGALRVLDAGTGGGLPGIPLAIARPHWHLLLVDAVEKKTAFLQHARGELQLSNIEVRHARLEALDGPDLQNAFDVIVSRAFSSLADFVMLTRKLHKPSGLWAAMKGRRPDDEVRALPPGVRLAGAVTLRVPMLDEQRHLILLETEPAQSVA